MTATNNVRKPETNMQKKYTDSDLLNANVKANIESKMGGSSIKYIQILTSTYDTIELGILTTDFRVLKTSVRFNWEGQEDKPKEAILRSIVNPGVLGLDVPVSRKNPAIDFGRWVENMKRYYKKMEGKAC